MQLMSSRRGDQMEIASRAHGTTGGGQGSGVTRPPGRTIERADRARSVKRRLAVPGPLELEEAVGPGHEYDPVPQPACRLTPRDRRDHRAEDSLVADPDDGRAHVRPDDVEGLVMRPLDLVVELGAVRGGGQGSGQGDL